MAYSRNRLSRLWLYGSHDNSGHYFLLVVIRSPGYPRRPGSAPHNVGGMNPAEFANIAQSERELWWYRGMRTILYRMLDPFLAGRKLSTALEAGCGTGYLSRLLQHERKWPVVPLDVSSEGLQYARKMGV